MNNLFHILLATLILFCLSYQPILGQTTNEKKKIKYYQAWVSPTDGSPTIKGYMSGVEDNQIAISDLSLAEWQRFDLSSIEKIKFRKEGAVGRGFAIGALSGFAIGVIVGLSGKENPNCLFCPTPGQKALFGGLAGAVPGALIGGIVGAVKIKVPINGKMKNQKEELLKYKVP